jgi:hypothetical protein
MKTAKVLIIAILLVITSIGISNADGFTKAPPAKKIISITLVQANQNPDLLIAMYQQLDPGFLKSNQASYTRDIKYNNYIVRVTGSYEQWMLFFKAKPIWE